MLRMILADDEPVITRGIKKLVNWEGMGIAVTGEYDNGSSAMEQILLQKPELALLDIAMPGMDGIEILKSIRKLELPTKVIFISGFQDFEYAKSALTYGAVEYLLKPVIREELLKAVEKAVADLEGGLRMPEETSWETGYLESHSEKDAPETVHLEQTTYIPVLSEVLFEGDESGQEQKLIRFSFRSFLEEYLQEHQLGILFQKKEHLIMVLKGLETLQAKAVLSDLWEKACQVTGKRSAFAAGKTVDSMGKIPEEYENCLELSRYFFFADQIKIPVLTTGEDVFLKRAGAADLASAREQVMDGILAQDRTAFENAFERFSRVVCLLCEGRKEDACYYFCTAVRLVEEKMLSLNLEGKNPNIGELLEKGRQCQNFLQMRRIFREYLEGYPALLKSAMENNEKKDILKAKEYIEKHYQENLTLEILAGHIHMNPYYFSSYFKKNAGENFKDYVNRVRVEHAVSLLISTDKKTYEIAAEVGFRDVRSFTEVFSRTYGETPNSYRRRVLSGFH